MVYSYELSEPAENPERGPDCLNLVKHAPWNRHPGAAGAGGEVPEDTLVEMMMRVSAQRGVVWSSPLGGSGKKEI